MIAVQAPPLDSEAERKKEIAEAAWQQVTESFDVLEAALAKAEWLAGPAFSVGDLNVAAALYRALAIDTKKWPHTQAWLTAAGSARQRSGRAPCAKANRTGVRGFYNQPAVEGSNLISFIGGSLSGGAGDFFP
jgi:glutathione S-transferase